MSFVRRYLTLKTAKCKTATCCVSKASVSRAGSHVVLYSTTKLKHMEKFHGKRSPRLPKNDDMKQLQPLKHMHKLSRCDYA